MKNLTLLLFVLISFSISSQVFTWMRGSSSYSPAGNYGTQGVSSPLNDPKGRHGCATWTDKQGNLWLFGGEGIESGEWNNDLWKYNPNTNEWTWVRGSNVINSGGTYGTMGVASPLNDPGAREFAVSWTDTSGRFYLFGGDGFDVNSSYGMLDDLWRYDPNTNQWTWIKGFNTVDQNGVYGSINVPSSVNMPGSRYGSATWSVGDIFYLYGGNGFPASGPSGYLNDLWRYNSITNEWTWLKGSNLTNQAGNYGTLNTPSINNFPPGREFPSFWRTSNNDLYLFGGRGNSSVSNTAYQGDMWKYNITTNTWTWLHGANTGNQLAVFGTQGQPAPGNTPGAGMSSASWTDKNDNLWLFGGFGYGTAYVPRKNSLFKYSTTTGEWTWIKGAQNVTPPGSLAVYGTMGAGNIANLPGGRSYNTWWKGMNGDFWLLGGEGIADTLFVTNMNDLWKFSCIPDSVTSSITQVCSGQSATLTAHNSYSANVLWYNNSTTTISLGNGSVFVTPPLSAFNGPATYYFYPEVNSCELNARRGVSVTVTPGPTITISGPAGVCDQSSASFTASGVTSFTWLNGSNTSTSTVAATGTSVNVIVLGRDANNCESSASYSIPVHPLPTFTITSSTQSVCAGEHVTIGATGNYNYLWHTGQNTPSISMSPTTNVSFTTTATDINNCSTTKFFTQHVQNCNSLPERTDAGFSIYPNPGNITLYLSAENLAVNEVSVYNLSGQKVLTQKIQDHQIDISSLVPGVYFLHVSNNDRTARVVKFIVAR